MARTLWSILVVVLLCGCCSHPEAVKALDRAIAANAGHMRDTSLPKEAREIAQDNYDLANQVRFALTGEDVPADTKERMDARTGGAQ